MLPLRERSATPQRSKTGNQHAMRRPCFGRADEFDVRGLWLLTTDTARVLDALVDP
jgi:hypothetical protein